MTPSRTMVASLVGELEVTLPLLIVGTILVQGVQSHGRTSLAEALR